MMLPGSFDYPFVICGTGEEIGYIDLAGLMIDKIDDFDGLSSGVVVK